MIQICCVTHNLGGCCSFLILGILVFFLLHPGWIHGDWKSTHLDAVFKDVSRDGKAFLPVNGLTEDDQLLKQEDSSLLGSRQKATVLLCDSKGVLLKQLALGCDLSLVSKQKKNR